MRITLSTARLAAALKATSMAAPTRPTSPILAAVHLEVTTDGLDVSAYDLDTSAQITIDPDALDVQEGSAFVSHRLLTQVLGVASAKTCDLDIDERAMTVKSGRAAWTLPLMSGADWPQLPGVPTEAGTVDAEEFAAAVAAVAPAVAGDDSGLPQLTGVWIVEAEPGRLTLVATDRYRLHSASIPFGQSAGLERGVLVPAARAVGLSRLLDGNVTLRGGQDDGLFGVDTGRLRMTTRLLDDANNGNWIRWDSFGNSVKNAKLGVIVSKADLLGALKQTLAVSDMSAPALLFLEIIDDSISVTLTDATGHGPGAGASATIDAKLEGDPIRVCVNGGFMQDFISGMASDEIDLQIAGPTKAMSAGPVGGSPERFLMVIRNDNADWLT